MNEAQHHILVVDDDARLRDLLTRYLSEQGFSVKAVGDSQQMEKVRSREHYHLIVLDLMLPGEDGLTICRRLRGTGDQTPVIMLTAKGDEVDRIVGLELGGDDYVAKPFSPREVVSRIRAILRRLDREPRPARPARQADPAPAFRHEADAQRIAFHDQWLSLTRYEYALLALLLERPGRILSRSQIMENVWQDGGESLERTVDTHIKTLRSKLRAIRDEEVIQTHRGIGYSLTA